MTSNFMQKNFNFISNKFIYSHDVKNYYQSLLNSVDKFKIWSWNNQENEIRCSKFSGRLWKREILPTGKWTKKSGGKEIYVNYEKSSPKKKNRLGNDLDRDQNFSFANAT